jgi:hypothetical protein
VRLFVSTRHARRFAAISEGLAALQPHVDTLLALRPAVAQFERAFNAHGYTVYHRELPEGVIRAVKFFTKEYNGGCDVAALHKRWQELADSVK